MEVILIFTILTIFNFECVQSSCLNTNGIATDLYENYSHSFEESNTAHHTQRTGSAMNAHTTTIIQHHADVMMIMTSQLTPCVVRVVEDQQTDR